VPHYAVSRVDARPLHPSDAAGAGPWHDAGEEVLDMPPEIGQVAPDFTLNDAAGGSFHLADACREQPLVLVFYRGHW
jgi:hypothetical protein